MKIPLFGVVVVGARPIGEHPVPREQTLRVTAWTDVSLTLDLATSCGVPVCLGVNGIATFAALRHLGRVPVQHVPTLSARGVYAGDATPYRWVFNISSEATRSLEPGRYFYDIRAIVNGVAFQVVPISAFILSPAIAR